MAVSREVSWPSFAGVGGVSGRVLPWRLELDVPRTCNKSKVWQHFGFTKKDGKFDKTHAICKICRAAIKYTGSTTNLGTHLKRRHGDTSASSSDSAMATVASSTSTPSKQTEQSIATFFHAPLATNSARSKAKTEAIAFFICKDIQPYSVVENEGFQATQANQLAKPLAYASQLVTSERVFSTAGDIATAPRSLLHPDHVDQLIFLKKTLKIGQMS